MKRFVQPSLRRQLIVRMFAIMLPLLTVLWIVAYFSSQYFINAAFDRSLERRAYALADRVEVVEGQVRVDLPRAARELLLFDPEDVLFHSITGPRGEAVEGEPNMPPLPWSLAPGRVLIYDGRIEGDKVRVAAFALSLQGTRARGTLLVRVGETMTRRTLLAERATLAIVIPMLLATLVAAGAIAYGVARGLQPLSRLRDRLAARDAFDLSPVPLEGAPAELRPFLDEINSLLQRLAEAVEGQSRFVANAAHQLRTPIAGIRAQAEAALGAGQHEDATHALVRIADAARTMGDLVQKLLVLARVDAAENTLRLVRLDSVELVKEVAREWVPHALAKGVEIELEVTAADAWVSGDVQLLREMLSNLIDNALRYGGNHILLRVGRSGPAVNWQVADNGPGIPTSERDAVFAPFHRISTGIDGAGLGLTIVERIAQLHAAAVVLGAGPGEKGLVVDITFPPA